MNKISLHILRTGLAITFIWIGILIFRNPEAWGGYISPWALELIPIPIREAMIGTALLDMAIGIFLLFNSFVWIAALLGTLHLIIVLITSGINDVTIRDIGLLGAIVALFIDSLPASIGDKIKSWRNRKTI
ncbi:hypothetical protein A2917_03170 [Candidatus Nomurabacteria bacterium RIFCSPLOWO2_01_FULL_42_17]|uniref:DoxX family protein n=1 Tax=Candidatus Nomurabacteria bacterium RIFCSPLOWO2_01_FULL_42_17 TaxID=1801780 RepID=A0A1F6XN12_9BACT|nr:MAG: hypothetical protein A2917_03170 [Candidatus Nomurabacteria bacterium RIFCSPLOWO2_01_FULL_42_17]